MIAAIIQARMGSTRLPNKTLMKIEGNPMLWHVLERVKRCSDIDKTVIATTLNPKDKQILDFAKEYGVAAFRGSEQDVLDRVYKVAKEIGADAVVRVTPDCPLICPEVVSKVVTEFRKGGYDYVANTLVYTYPDGCDVEVFSFGALEKAWRQCKDPAEREHVTPYMRNSRKFRTKNVVNENPIDPRRYKWSVDNENDLKFVREVYNELYGKRKSFSYEDVMRMLKRRPEVSKINEEEVINEGYYRSIMRSGRVKPKKISIKRSLALKARAKKLIPDCSQTFSKGPSQFVQGVAPVFLERGYGSHVWDIDGNKYIDYAMALGPIILGHSHPVINREVTKILRKGISFTLPHRMEVELAQLLCEIIPCAEMVRFGKNGSDATSGAVRVARAYTGRDIIACCGYHGWQDWYVATTTRDGGVPDAVKKLTITFEYNDIESLKKIFAEHPNRVACVIMEAASVTEPKEDFLKRVKEIARRNGAVLIFDEIVTGFRFSLGGAQDYFGVEPDLACFGKAMGNGFPIAAVVGKKEIMKLFEDIFFSFTFGGELVSIAASIATIRYMKEHDVIAHLWEQGRKIKDGYNVMAKGFGLSSSTGCVGYPPRTVITFKYKNGNADLMLKSLFQQECIRRGILFSGGHNICHSHTNKDIDYTLRVYMTVLEIIKDAIDKHKVEKLLKGKPVKPIFRRV